VNWSPNEAALRFARELVTERGRVSDKDLAQVRKAGFSEGEITEIIANVALNLFTNYFNHVADTSIDFPIVPPLVEHQARQYA
jgi:alkylhydroperoxidase family enzyme